jgi:hypothetical protein
LFGNHFLKAFTRINYLQIYLGHILEFSQR